MFNNGKSVVEVRLPTGLTIQMFAEKNETEQVTWNRLGMALDQTDWDALRRVYGVQPVILAREAG
jgi:hypothetical protein